MIYLSLIPNDTVLGKPRRRRRVENQNKSEREPEKKREDRMDQFMVWLDGAGFGIGQPKTSSWKL